MNEEIKKYPEVIQYVGKLIYERGWEYFKRNNITSFELTDGVIRAFVRGSKDESYKVVIRISDDKVESSECSCPYWARCKHIASVLIYYFYNKNENKDAGSIGVVSATPTERTIFLDFDAKPRSISGELIRNVKLAIAETQPAFTDDRLYKLVFRLSKRQYEAYPGWIISPGARLLRKDGTPGNVYSFSNGKRLTQATAEEEKLLKKLLRYPEKSDSIVNHLDALIENKDIELIISSEYKSLRVRREEFSKIKVSFDLARIDKAAPVFYPVFSFFLKNDESTVTVPAFRTNVVRSGTWLCCFTANGHIFYCRDDRVLEAALTGLSDASELSPGEISQITDFFEKARLPEVELDFKIKSVTVTSPMPAKILEIEQRFLGLIVMRLYFDYMGIEVQYGKGEPVVSKKTEGDRITVVRRNYSNEEEILSLVKHFVGDQPPLEYYVAGITPGTLVLGNDLNSFLSEAGYALMQNGFSLRIGKGKRLSGATGRMRLSITSGIDWFDVSVSCIESDGKSRQVTIDPQDAFRGLLKSSESYILLELEDIKKIQELVSLGIGANGRMRVSKYNLGFIGEFYDYIENKDDPEIARIRDIYERLKNARYAEEQGLPAEFKGVLREYQRTGYNWMQFLRASSLGGLLADDMGLGKTVQTLALLQKQKEEGSLRLSLLVVPVTTIANWENEIRRFAPLIGYFRHAGPLRPRSFSELPGFDIIIVSYQTLRNDLSLFSSMEFDYLVLDESQSIKNASTKAYKAVRSLNARHKLALTGTPVENSSLELWAIMDILNPGLLRSMDDFKRRFGRPIQEHSDSEASSRLRKIVGPFILRRKKEDVLSELKDLELIDLRLEMNEQQSAAYEEVKADFRERIKSRIAGDGLAKSRALVLEGLLRLRQMVLFPEIVSERYTGVESSKFELLKDMLEDILSEDHKILVYSQFVSVLKIIEKHVAGLSFGYVYLDGSTKHRSQIIEKFQKDPLTRIFLLSLKAGGLGINLTSADYVVLFDPWWNPAIEAQALARSHRIGQTKKVIGYKLIARNTVEEKILLLQEEKQRIVKDIIAEDASVFKYLDADQIIGLFS